MDQVHGTVVDCKELVHYPHIGYVCPKTTCSWIGKTLEEFKVKVSVVVLLLDSNMGIKGTSM